jgi:hypothetical protein
MKLKIDSDGTPNGTKVMTEDGTVLSGVTFVQWSLAVGHKATATIVVREVPVQLRGEAISIGRS